MNVMSSKSALLSVWLLYALGWGESFAVIEAIS
jgi:hypothetical protein